MKRFTQRGRPGAYLRVVEEGRLQAGDTVSVVDQPGHRVSVGTAFRALTTDRELLPRVLEVESLAGRARERLRSQSWP